MYFKKLEIFGFKSFADRTVLNFEPGITAIVGPNGCGKSNIFDAVRWVLGEQSIKELRGSTMEDVIFNGTDKKPGLGFAEVSLTFSNESRMLPVEHDEVTVSRRLFRSGESEYLFNKTSVRLKDILEFFMGTGIGAEAYSLVQQGKVDLVVSAKPEDRRVILDEAAGITRYKSKKKEALNKLKDTENNLLRINDIIIEVKRQIASIERQANKARRYKEEFEKLKDLEVLLAKHQLTEFDVQRHEIKMQVSALKEQEAKLNAELEELNSLILHETSLLEELEEKVNNTNAEDIKLDNQIEINNRQIGFNQERVENIHLNEARINEQKEQLTERCRVQQEKIETLKQSLSALQEFKQKNIWTLQEKKAQLNSITHAIQSAKENILQNEEKILDITSQQVGIKNQLTDVMKEIQGGLARKRRLELENSKVTSEKQQVDQKLQSVIQQIEKTLTKIQGSKVEQESQNQVLEKLKEELFLLEQTIDDLEKKKLFLKSQKEFIEKLRVQYQDIPDPVVEGRLFTTTAPLEHYTGIIGKVKEVLAMDDSKTGSLKDFLPQAAGQNLYEIICEAKFIELDPQQIILKIDELSRNIDQETQIKNSVIAQVEEHKAIMERIIQDVLNEEKELSIYEAQKKDILGETSKLLDELELVGIEIEEVNGSLNSLNIAEKELSHQLNLSNQELEWCQNNIKENQQVIAFKTQQREETTVAIAQLETEIGSIHDKVKSHLENCQIFTEALDSSLTEMKKLDDERAQLIGKKDQYVREIGEIEETIEELRKRKQSFKTLLLDYQRQKDDLTQRINSVRMQVASYNTEIEKIHQGYHSDQLREQEIYYKEKEIKDRLFQAYKINMDELPAPPGDVPVEETKGQNITPPSPLNPKELLVEIDRLKRRCESFGAVNLVAIEEFDQLRERFEFLIKQQSDLLTAKESLMLTISKINRTTKQMFMETFTRVSEEFRIYFRMLFGGGEAQLVLLDPENVLESGIEIIARPPGKKLQNISLLSGGEKSLTAIALIFGVFKVRPSPFCVLDEIDAALDESNVGRFSYLLKDFSKIAQFIVITHNKKTITCANVMYGITMQETGVSKIVSVKFAGENKRKQEIAEPVGAV